MKLSLLHFERALETREAQRLTGSSHAAVAIILREQRKRAEVLVIQRALHPADPWSGHLAFPGGRADAGDADLRATAVRETREELGLDLEQHGRWLGALDWLSAAPVRSHLVIAPFVFALTDDVPLSADAREVTAHVWTPVSPLAEGQQDGIHRVRRGPVDHKMPAYDLDIGKLWGLSYRMLNSLLRLAGASYEPEPPRSATNGRP